MALQLALDVLCSPADLSSTPINRTSKRDSSRLIGELKSAIFRSLSIDNLDWFEVGSPHSRSP
jgi:hypothetical protein